MFVRAIVEEGVDETAILAPQQGVTRDPKGNATRSWSDAEGKVRSRVAADRAPIGDRWLVTSGLADGDQLIVDGLLNIRPDVPVTAFEAALPAAGAAPADGAARQE